VSELLTVEDLRVEFVTGDGVVHAVDGISYSVDQGRTLGIVGESGSGKTVSSLTTLGLTRGPRARIAGRIMFEGQDLVAAPSEALRSIRGNEIAMIFQDPLSSLHPFYKVGKQLVEAMQVHQSIGKAQARERAAELLDLVNIPDPQRRVDQYPHEFSGGMRQRVMIAMALANDPKLLIADEPTTALDVTVQAQILALLEDLQERLGMAVILITHDLGVVAEIADEIGVMYAGRIVERAPTEAVFNHPQHPYTWGLLRSIPRLDSPDDEELVPISGRPPSLIARPSALGAGGKKHQWRYDFMGASRYFFTMSGVILLVGALAIGGRGLNLAFPQHPLNRQVRTNLQRAPHVIARAAKRSSAGRRQPIVRIEA